MAVRAWLVAGLVAIVTIALLSFCTGLRPAHAAPYESTMATAPDMTTAALVAELRTLGRDLVQRQLPKGSPPLPETHPLLRHAYAAAQILAEETAGVDPAMRSPFARMVFTMAGFESGWQANPKGSNDLGAACGALQLHDPQIHYRPDVSCTMLRKDLRLGLRAGMAVIRALTAKHGHLAAGLTAYATDGTYKGWILPEIARRCALAGVNCTLVKIGSAP